MHIRFSPMRSDGGLSLSKTGDSLTINGEVFDFSALPEGGILPRDAVACPWLVSDVTRQSGEIHLSLILPVGAVAPEQSRFPTPLDVTADGPVPLPGEAQ